MITNKKVQKHKCDFCEKYFPKEELSKPEGKEYSHILLCQDCLEDIMSGVKKIESEMNKD